MSRNSINYLESSEIEQKNGRTSMTHHRRSIDSRQCYLLNVCDARSSRSFIFGDQRCETTEWVWLFYNRQKTLSRKTVRVLNRLSPGVSTTRLLVNLYFLDCIPGAQSMIVTRDSQYFEAISFEEESELHIFQRQIEIISNSFRTSFSQILSFVLFHFFLVSRHLRFFKRRREIIESFSRLLKNFSRFSRGLKSFEKFKRNFRASEFQRVK